MTEIESKHGVVSRSPMELYTALEDLGNLKRMLPPERQEGVSADRDTLTAHVQGFDVGVKIHNRVPCSCIELVDYGAPFAFHVALHFDPVDAEPRKTAFHICAEADLNLMMKLLLKDKVKEALDKIVDALVDASAGKFPSL